MTNQSFGYGKVEIRAAMPKGELLWADLSLWSVDKKENRTVKRIRMILFDQLKTYNLGVFYEQDKNINTTWRNVRDNNLNQFNVYSVEWNETTIIWKLNYKEVFAAKLINIYPELNRMQIGLIQGVGGKRFDYKYNFVSDIKHWECPTLLVDYVRYYRWVNETITEKHVTKRDNPSKDVICRALHKRLSDISISQLNPSFLLIVTIVLSVFLIIVLIIFLCFYTKYKNLRQNSNNVMSDGNVVYDDLHVNYYSKPVYEENYDVVLESPSIPLNDN